MASVGMMLRSSVIMVIRANRLPYMESNVLPLDMNIRRQLSLLLSNAALASESNNITPVNVCATETPSAVTCSPLIQVLLSRIIMQ